MYTIPSKVMHNANLPATAKLVYAVIFLHCNNQGFSSVPQKEIMEAANVTRLTVNKSIHSLKDEGLIRVTRPNNTNNVYEVLTV